MGGSGSGRPWDYIYTVEDCTTIDINWLKREQPFKLNHYATGTIRWTRNGVETGSIGYEVRLGQESEYIRIHYTYKKTEDIDYRIPLCRTYPHFGGIRWWFRCPAQGCGKRVAKLYSPPGYRYFLCRICQNLTYTSCRESHQFDGLFARISAESGLPLSLIKREYKR